MSQNILPANTQALLIQALGDLEPMVLSKDHPVLDRFSKKKMGGKGLKQPIMTGWGGGVSGDFATSLANAKVNVANAEAFSIDPAVVYGNEILDWTSQRYTEDPDASAIDIAILATKASMEIAADNFASMIFGDGSGVLARIRTATQVGATTVWDLVLYNVTDVAKFAQDFVIQQKTTPFAATINTGEAEVTGLNQLAGSIRVDVGASGLTPVAGRYIGLKGQIQASTDVVTFPGIFGYVPKYEDRDSTSLLPTVSTFLGVDRGPASAGVAVSGWAFRANGNPISVLANRAAGAMSNYKNAKPNVMFCNGEDLPKLANEAQQEVRTNMPSRNGGATIFYSGFTLNLTTGPVEVLAEPACPAGFAVLTRDDQWVIGSPGKMFAPATNGQIMVPSYEENRSRFSTECSGYFTTSNPPATATLTLY